MNEPEHCAKYGHLWTSYPQPPVVVDDGLIPEPQGDKGVHCAICLKLKNS